MTINEDCPIKILRVEGSRPETGLIREAITEEGLISLIKDKVQGEAKLVLWLNHGVVFGKWQNDACVWAQPELVAFEQLVEMRVFNAEEELYLTTDNWRYRRDVGAEPLEVVDTSARLWGEGTAEEAPAGFICLRDTERRLTLTVPYEGRAEAKYYELKTRSYIATAEATGQAGYVDYRLVDIVEGRE